MDSESDDFEDHDPTECAICGESGPCDCSIQSVSEYTHKRTYGGGRCNNTRTQEPPTPTPSQD